MVSHHIPVWGHGMRVMGTTMTMVVVTMNGAEDNGGEYDGAHHGLRDTCQARKELHGLQTHLSLIYFLKVIVWARVFGDILPPGALATITLLLLLCESMHELLHASIAASMCMISLVLVCHRMLDCMERAHGAMCMQWSRDRTMRSIIAINGRIDTHDLQPSPTSIRFPERKPPRQS